MSVAPLLVFGWGNASRGDDALGPLFVQELQARLGAAAPGRVDFLDDYQLQPEHALDLAGRAQLLFVDASRAAAAPFEAAPVAPRRDASFSSHAMSPAALLQAFADVHGQAPPPALLLAIRGEAFELGDPLGAAARRHLDAALDWAQRWIAALPLSAGGAR